MIMSVPGSKLMAALNVLLLNMARSSTCWLGLALCMRDYVVWLMRDFSIGNPEQTSGSVEYLCLSNGWCITRNTFGP